MWENLHTLHTNTKLFLKLLVVARATLEYCAWKKVLYLYLACEIRGPLKVLNDTKLILYDY